MHSHRSPLNKDNQHNFNLGYLHSEQAKTKKKRQLLLTAMNQKKKIDLSGLVQLITAGMGSPFLGNFEGVEKDTGKMMFSLEANNLVDEVSVEIS